VHSSTPRTVFRTFHKSIHKKTNSHYQNNGAGVCVTGHVDCLYVCRNEAPTLQTPQKSKLRFARRDRCRLQADTTLRSALNSAKLPTTGGNPTKTCVICLAVCDLWTAVHHNSTLTIVLGKLCHGANLGQAIVLGPAAGGGCGTLCGSLLARRRSRD
jgi:hypothetical protein